MNIPTVSGLFAAFFGSGRPAGDPGVCLGFDARGRIEAGAALDAADPEPEAEL